MSHTPFVNNPELREARFSRLCSTASVINDPEDEG
jgi:hypothetical protein